MGRTIYAQLIHLQTGFVYRPIGGHAVGIQPRGVIRPDAWSADVPEVVEGGCEGVHVGQEPIGAAGVG